MANVWAKQNGVWSNVNTWNTLTVPTASDAVWASGSTVYIDQDITVQSLNTFASGTIGAGGTFATSASVNIATSTIRGGTSIQCLLITGSNITVNITGSSVGGSSNPSNGIAISSSFSTINISGSCTAGTNSNTFGIVIWGFSPTSNTIRLIGDCSGSTANVAGTGGFTMTGTQCNLIITGSLLGGTSNATNTGLFISTTFPYTASILGNVTGSTGPGLYYSTSATGTGSITINGNVIGGAGSSFFGINLPAGCANATLRVNGNVTAGPALNASGINVVGTSCTASINGNLTGGGAGGNATNGVQLTGTSCLAIITGSLTGGANINGSSYGLGLAGTSNNLIISGSINGGSLTSNNGGLGITAASPYTASIIGNVSTTTLAPGIIFASATGQGTVNITGSVTGGNGSTFTGINFSSTTNVTLNISGSVAGGGPAGTAAYGINLASVASATTVTIRGDVTGSAGTSYGVYNNSSAGIVIISGSAIALGGIAAYNNSTGQILISGSAIAGTVVGAHNQAASGIVRVIGAVASTASAALNGVNINGITTFESATFASNGQVPWLNYCKLVSGSNNFVSASLSGSGYKVLVDNNNIINGLPAASDVRLGTTYNFGSTTGTAAIPPANQVAAGVLVDNTTGSALLTTGSISTAVWDTQVSTLITTGSVGERLRSAATVASVGDQLTALI